MSHPLNEQENAVYTSTIDFLESRRKNLQKGETLTRELISSLLEKTAEIHEIKLGNKQQRRIIENLEELFIHTSDPDDLGATINSNEIPPWVPAKKPPEHWPFWYRYKKFLQKEGSLSPHDLQLLDEHTDKILEQCGNPKGESLDPNIPHPETWNIRGMVFGNVQMGKTSNYSGLICKAADAGYKVIIILAGIHENLRIQTQERIDESFIGRQSVGDPRKKRNSAFSTHVGVGTITVPGLKHVPSVLWATTRIDGGDFKTATARQFGVAVKPDTPCIVMVVKKNATVLRALLRWLVPSGELLDAKKKAIEQRLPPTPKTFAPKECPLLVIDDESDQASVDTAAGNIDDADGGPDRHHNPKTINRLIRSILRCFPRSSYVGYTATPFANILIHSDGETHQYGTDLFPAHFIRSLHIPSTYVGPSTIFGSRRPINDEENSEELEDDGIPELLEIVADHATPPNDTRAREGWMPPVHKKDHQVGSDIPQSLKLAITDFTLAGAGLICRGRGHLHQSMLIHVTRFQDVISALHKIVAEYWEGWSIKVKNGDHKAMRALQERWESSFQKSYEAVRNQRPWDRGIKHESWSELTQVDHHSGRSPLQASVEDVEVRQVHGGKMGQPLDYQKAKKEGKNLRVIAVGGGKLSRGLTLENLTTSYFLRTSRMYDTLMQMGRWFGYRPGYLDLCRVHMPEELRYWFCHMSDASDELREELERMQAQGSKPIDFGLRVRSHPQMQVTSSVKMRHGQKMRLGFSDSRPETVNYLTSSNAVKKNWGALSHLINELGKPDPNNINPTLLRPAKDPSQGDREKKYQGWMWKNIDHQHIVDFMKKLNTSTDATVANSNNIALYIEHMARRGELKKWTVFLRNNASATKRDGDKLPYDIHPGRSKRSRRPIEQIPERRGHVGVEFTTGILIDSDYETVDIDNDGYKRALESKRNCTSKTSNTDATEPGNWIRTVRPTTHGLLLLYPLQPIDRCVYKKDPTTGKALKDAKGNKVVESKEEEIKLTPDLPLVGFGVSFPASKIGGNNGMITYVVNNVFEKIAREEHLFESEDSEE